MKSSNASATAVSSMDRGSKKGMVLEIQRMSTEDGPGIRTTVFMKGCSLRCQWCHNPESISPQPQLNWMGVRCIGCRTCVDVCPIGALSLTEKGVVIDRERCTGCGDCSEACPSTALELLGEKWSLEALAAEVEKDRAYFEKSGGGVTVSGGEPVLQHQFVGDFLKRMRGTGLHTALDTCGLYKWEHLAELIPYTSLVLYDVKEIDADRHRRLTGFSNEMILKNLENLSAHMASHLYPREIWIRTPIIPGATANRDTISAVGRFLAERIRKGVTRWELCAFNNLCRDKYSRLGLDWAYKDADLLSEEEMEDLAEAARRSGVEPSIVHWSGSTRLDTVEEVAGE